MSGRSARAALVGAAAARLSYAALKARPPGGAATWTRSNHRGEAVTLLEGQAAAIGGIVGALAAGGSRRDRVAVAVAGAGAAAFGSLSTTLPGTGPARASVGILARCGRAMLTTGAVKIAGIGATGLTAALIAGARADAGRSDRVASGPLAVSDTLINAGLVAGGANLVNLFDLRPGRAIKVALLTGGLLAPSQRGRAAAAPLAAAPRSCPTIWTSTRCSAMAARTRSAPCSAPPPRSRCPELRGSVHSP